MRNHRIILGNVAEGPVTCGVGRFEVHRTVLPPVISHSSISWDNIPNFLRHLYGIITRLVTKTTPIKQKMWVRIAKYWGDDEGAVPH